MRTLCFYHSRDLDGWTSAAIVKKANPDAELIGWDYGDSLPTFKEKSEGIPLGGSVAGDAEIYFGDTVILTDISWPIDFMQKLALACQITWIDHHISAIMEYEEFCKKNNFNPVFTDKTFSFLNKETKSYYPPDTMSSLPPPWNAIYDPYKAACELTWEAFFPDDPIPEAVRLLGHYDSFQHKGTGEEERVLMFQYGARTLASNPQEAERFLDHNFPVGAVIHDGKAIYNHLKMEARQAYDAGFEGKIGNPLYTSSGFFRIIAKERINPSNFGLDYAADGYDGVACFWYRDHKWNWSLYSHTIDVSEIAKQYGGGGHKGAAGFISDEFRIWK